MKGRVAEFNWWVPDSGFQLVTIAAQVHEELRRHPAAVRLGIAGSPAVNDICISPEAAGKSLKAYFEGRLPLGPPNTDQATVLRAFRTSQTWDDYIEDAKG